MEFQVINRNRNAVIPEGMFKLRNRAFAAVVYGL